MGGGVRQAVVFGRREERGGGGAGYAVTDVITTSTEALQETSDVQIAQQRGSPAKWNIIIIKSLFRKILEDAEFSNLYTGRPTIGKFTEMAVTIIIM